MSGVVVGDESVEEICLIMWVMWRRAECRREF